MGEWTENKTGELGDLKEESCLADIWELLESLGKKASSSSKTSAESISGMLGKLGALSTDMALCLL